MISASRRQLLAGTGLVAFGGLLPAGCTKFAAAAGKGLAAGKPNLFIGTGGHGHTYPGASLAIDFEHKRTGGIKVDSVA